MTRIRPFKAVHYNPAKVGSLACVMCPPYDVISADEQSEYYNASPYNFIRVDLGKEKAGDNKAENKYTRAEKTFHDWLAKGILVQDEKPCIYYYKQEYSVRGQKHSRMGFISLMKLPNEDDSSIFPHENTHTHAIEDRFELWGLLKSNLSSIFVCFSDKERKVEKIFASKVSISKPILDVVDNDKVRHLLWRLDDPVLIEEIAGSLENQNLFIADGHHRFKVALELRRVKSKRRSKNNGSEPYNYVMTYFTNMDSKDLQILPMHRIIKKLPANLDFLEDTFRIDRVKTKEDLLILLAKAGQNEHAFGLYTRDGIKLLRLKNNNLIDLNIHEGSKEFRALDATILKYFVLDRLGIKSDDIIYTKDSDHATRMVDDHHADACFILNPVKIGQLKAIALNGERMPPKTTYFYPKVLSGLTVYKMDS